MTSLILINLKQSSAGISFVINYIVRELLNILVKILLTTFETFEHVYCYGSSTLK